MAKADQKRPFCLEWRSNTLFILSTVGIGLFTDLFLYGLIVPILPFILEDRINVPSSQIQTYTSTLLAAYAGASVVCSLPAGIIADKLSARRLPFLTGLLALLGATIMLYLGRSIAVLAIARVLQGISAAVVWTVGLAMVIDTVGSEKLGVTIGSIFSFISIGELLAPVLGGVVYEKAGYPGVFGMAFGVIGLDVIMRLLVIEKKTAAKFAAVGSPDSDGQAEDEGEEDQDAEAGNEESPLLNNNNNNGKREDEWKIKKDLPLIVKKFSILYCFSDPRVLTAEAVAFTQATLLAVFDSTIPTEAQSLFNVNSLKAGLLFLPLVMPYFLLGSLAGKGVDKYGTKPASVIGLVYLIPWLILLRLPQAGGTAEIVKFCVFLSLSGIGLALISAPSIVEASFVTEQYHKANKDIFGEEGPYAQLYAVNSMVFSLGLTLGPLVAGSLRDSIGYGNMNLIVSSLCLVVSILSYFFMGGKPRSLTDLRSS